ncbi:MAG: hypothetical protein BGO51_27855 [Rhodospirillales bacterium 69-11]|nr:hypothetical protein [Rhodospirillales bacterium]OJW25142.1 MAG: hypothetical protein BGO51_27855 [Rhodospirillales bacterium 69-11]
MPLYRVIRSSRRTALPSSTWMCKPTDEAAVAAVRELLKRGDYAEVWGEHDLVACLEPQVRSDAASIPAQAAGRTPMMRYVAAGFATTAGIALIFAAMQARSVPPADDAPRVAAWAMLDPVTTGAASQADAAHASSDPARVVTTGPALPGVAGASADPAATPDMASGGVPPNAADPDAAAVAGADPQGLQPTLASLAPDSPEAPVAEAPAARPHAVRHTRHQPAPRHWRAEQGQVFASGERSSVDVYSMFARGYVQGGN